MIRHIVLWTFKESAGGAEKQENIAKAFEKLVKLKDSIQEIKFLECGKNFTMSADSFDLALVCEFENVTDLEKYQVHPAHLEVVKWLHTVRELRVVADYEI